MVNKGNIKLRNLFILLGSTLSVMQGALITPALTQIASHFDNIENIDFLTKLIIAIPPIFIALFSPVFGVLFEKFGRKKILIFASLIYAIAGSSGYFADDIYLILIGRAVLGVSIAGLMTGFIIVIGDLFPEKIQMNKFIGYQGALMSFGGVFYLLLGELLVNVSWNLPFTAYLFSILIAIGLLLFLTETKSIDDKLNLNIKVKEYTSKEFFKIHILAVGIMVCYLMIPTQIPFILREFPELNNKNVGIFLAIWILFSSISSILYSQIIKRLDYQKSFSLAFFIWGLGFSIIFFSNSIYLVLLSLVLSGIGNGIAIPNLKAQLLNLVKDNERSKQSGLLSMSLYIGQFLSPLIMEPIINFSEIRFPFLLFSFLMLLISIVFYYRNGINYRK